MKRNLILLLIITGTFLFTGLSTQHTYSQCPKGVRYNCVYGCGRHTDLNNDGFCDFSYVTKTDTVQKKSGTDTIGKANQNSKDTAAIVHSKKNTVENPSEKRTRLHKRGSDGPGVGESGSIQNNLAAPAENSASELSETAPLITPPVAQKFIPSHQEPVYHLILVTILTFVLYFTTLLLYRRNIITRIHHRKLWNLLLLLTFLVSCLFGLFLVVQINYNIAMGAFKTLLYWHVEIGVAMTLIAIIHILWHFPYFRKMFSKRW